MKLDGCVSICRVAGDVSSSGVAGSLLAYWLAN